MKWFTARSGGILLVALMLGGLLAAGVTLVRRPERKPPHEIREPVQGLKAGGRLLYVVVDVDGDYVGEEFIPFILFDQFLKDHRWELKPDYVLVVGTGSSRHGHVIEALLSVRGVLKVPTTIATRVIQDGKRLGPIEVRDFADCE